MATWTAPSRASWCASRLSATRSWPALRAGHGRIGHPQGEKSVSLIAIHNHGLRDRFGEDVLGELEVAAQTDDGAPRGSDAHTARHHRSADARDFDDAVWAEPDPDPQRGRRNRNRRHRRRVVVCAARRRARPRGPGAAIRSISPTGRADAAGSAVERLCSLPEVERACIAVRMTFDRTGKHALATASCAA